MKKKNFRKEFRDKYYEHYKESEQIKRPRLYTAFFVGTLFFLVVGLFFHFLYFGLKSTNTCLAYAEFASYIIAGIIFAISELKCVCKDYKNKLLKKSLKAIDRTFEDTWHPKNLYCKEKCIDLFKRDYSKSWGYLLSKIINKTVAVWLMILFSLISLVYPSVYDVDTKWITVVIIGFLVIQFLATYLPKVAKRILDDYLYDRVCTDYKYYLAEQCIYGEPQNTSCDEEPECIEKIHKKIKFRIKETLQFLSFAFYPPTTLVVCTFFSGIVIIIFGIGMVFTPQNSDSYNMVFALTTGAVASFFVTFVVELTNNYRHNKLAWYELQEYYSAIMNYESYKQIMMQRTPHQQAEKKAYDEFMTLGGVEEKEKSKDIIQITWEQLSDLIPVLRRTLDDKKELLSDAEIEELKIIFLDYKQIHFLVQKRILMPLMTYDALNHPDEEYLKSIYPSDVIKNMPDWIKSHLASEESQNACNRYVDAILSDSFLLSNLMKNYDISQNGLESYQNEVYHMEEMETDESENIDYDDVDFSETDNEETFRAQREEFYKQMELEQRPLVSWLLSKCCLDIAESLDILAKRIRKKPYYGMLMEQ